MKRSNAFYTGSSTLLAVLAVAGVGLQGNTVHAQAPADEPPPPLPVPLSRVPVPEPPNLADFVQNRLAAIQLGKALFWDMQVGSDGVQACGSCHFHAGADRRLKNQLNPDLNASPAHTTFDPPGRPNLTLKAEDFPFHQLANPDDPQSLLADHNNVVSSQGVFKTLFLDVIPGSAQDRVLQVDDPVFNVNGIKVRRVEPRNTPTVINAIFNHRNFWDGRAQSDFNGVNPFGSRDANARVLQADPVTGMPHLVQVSLTSGASLASLSTGPPLSAFEMSAEGRTLRKLGKKLLSLRPLARQLVAPDDSALGPLSNYWLNPRLRGLNTTYVELIRAAFRPEWWRSETIVTYDANGTPSFRDRMANPTLTTNEYTVMEANFALFFGLSVQLYLATLVSDDTPFDRFLGGQTNAMTPQQQDGFNLFRNKAGCVRCHVGSELTEASFAECFDERIDTLTNLAGVVAKYDKGFLNTGVRPTTEDPGIGGTDPFGNSFSDSLRLKRGQLPANTFNLPVGRDEAIAVQGAFKIPGLRNVELTGPYFHNGSVATLAQVVEFYNRGGNFSSQDAPNIRNFMRPLGLKVDEKAALVAFLKALTDERVRFEKGPFDHPQIFVPNGHPGDENQVAEDGRGKAMDDLMEIKAVGAGGGGALPPVFPLAPVGRE